MSRIIMGLVLDTPLSGGLSDACLIRAVHALIDFDSSRAERFARIPENPFQAVLILH